MASMQDSHIGYRDDHLYLWKAFDLNMLQQDRKLKIFNTLDNCPELHVIPNLRSGFTIL